MSSKKSIIPSPETTVSVDKTYELYPYPIAGVSEERAVAIATKAGYLLRYGDQYAAARDAARSISGLPGIRRVDIRSVVVSRKSTLAGAYSAEAYMTHDRSDPAADFHPLSKKGNAPPETRHIRKTKKFAKRAAAADAADTAAFLARRGSQR